MCALCSQANDAGNYKLVGTYFMQARLIAYLTCLPLWSVWIAVIPVIQHITGDVELAEGTGRHDNILH